MLYLAVSTPHPSKPDDVNNTRLKFWSWINDLKTSGKVVCFYPRVGRGIVAIFDVSSNDELHNFMTQWTNIVPVNFDIYPLATPSEAEALLK
jgi:muconolactone delta-isomerase